MLYLKHLLKFYFASYIASGFILLGMIGVVAGNMGLCWLMISMVFKTQDQMTSIWSPIILIGIVTFIVVGVFLGSFDDAVLATLMSLAVDIETNGEVKHGTPSFHDKLAAIEKSLGENLSVNHHVVVHAQQQPLMGNNTHTVDTTDRNSGVNRGGNQMYEGGAEF